ncbi:MAG: TetR/AcrR family transcriptional regulator [Dehalococcoidia bacterium]|nr:TetR/AcrR family transcriptional regulator [Dehalococcoidia bacterium]MDD5493795.1 TetR/AcrR family transcriptional regulator [Dehalococcoidia bacterium]
MARTPTYRELKAQILENASELFRKQGYQGTTMDQIAGSVGMSKVRVYRYWDSKEEILFEAIKVFHRRFINSLRKIVESNEAPENKLRQAIANHATVFYSALLPFAGGIVSPEPLITGKHRRAIVKLRDEYDSLLYSIIEEGMESGAFIKCDPRLTSFAIMGAANYVRMWFSASGPLTLEEVTNYLADYLANGILSPKYRKNLPPLT